MNTLSSKLRATIRDHVDHASSNEIRLITSLLCSEDPPAIAPTEVAAAAKTRFEVLDETVRDNETGLVWTRRNASEKRLAWTEAKEACEKLELDGGGWRLPTIKELLSLVDYERSSPAIDPAFECNSDWYWASTPVASVSGCAWFVLFGVGGARWVDRYYYGFVRAVRGGQF